MPLPRLPCPQGGGCCSWRSDSTPARTFTLPPLVLGDEDRAAIAEDPLMFIIAQREQDVPVQAIRSELVLAGMSDEDADGLLGQAEALCKPGQRMRGIQRIQKGVAFVAVGVLTIPLLWIAGFFSLFSVVLVLTGVYQLVRGIQDVKGG